MFKPIILNLVKNKVTKAYTQNYLLTLQLHLNLVLNKRKNESFIRHKRQ